MNYTTVEILIGVVAAISYAFASHNAYHLCRITKTVRLTPVTLFKILNENNERGKVQKDRFWVSFSMACLLMATLLMFLLS